jgi:hypothetical protein
MLVGIVWALWVGLMYLVMSGMAEPISVSYASLYYTAMLVGPVILVVGPVLVLNQSQPKLGAVLAIIGCVILTISVAHETISGFHVQPLQAKPPYLLFTFMVVVTLFADASAFRLYQLVSSISAVHAP